MRFLFTFPKWKIHVRRRYRSDERCIVRGILVVIDALWPGRSSVEVIVEQRYSLTIKWILKLNKTVCKNGNDDWPAVCIVRSRSICTKSVCLWPSFPLQLSLDVRVFRLHGHSSWSSRLKWRKSFSWIEKIMTIKSGFRVLVDEAHFSNRPSCSLHRRWALGQTLHLRCFKNTIVP